MHRVFQHYGSVLRCRVGSDGGYPPAQWRLEFCGQGYAYEAALAVLTHTKNALPIKQLAAITSPTNERSNRLLIKLGFIFQKTVVLPGDSEETRLYRLVLQP